MRYRTCTKCGDKLPATLEFFYKYKANKFGLQAECKVCANKYGAKYRKNNKEKNATGKKKWYEKNKEKAAATMKKWQGNNRDKCATAMKKYRKNNKEKCVTARKKWYKDNPDKVNAYAAKHRALRLKQTPVLTETEHQQIELIYKKRDELGSNYHVDHIQPLSKGGLHHPNNLQIVTEKYNLQKGSKLNFRLPSTSEIFNLDGLIKGGNTK